MVLEPSYSQRAMMCNNISQCVRDPEKFPQGRANLFGRGADYLDGMTAADVRDYGNPLAVTGLHDYKFLGDTTSPEECVVIVPKFPQWSAALRAGAIPESVRDEIDRFFGDRGEKYEHAMQYEASAAAIRDDE